MASRREYEMLFMLNAQLGSNYNSTFKSAQSPIAAMQKEIEALNKIQANITAYEKQQAAIEATRKRLENLQQQYDNIQKEIVETGTFSSDLQNKLLAKQQQIDKTSASIETQSAKLNQMGSALRAAGVDTESLGKESAKLGGQIDELKQKQEEAAEKAQKFGQSATVAFTTVQQAIVAAGIGKTLQEIYDLFMSCADASMEFESAMTGVDKTTDLTNEELTAMGQAFKELSSEDIPATTDELAAIAETAGQLGIEKQSLLDFTEIMAMLGTATNMTSDEAATMLAQFASITGMDSSFYSNLGAVIVGLGNNYATTERNIADMSQTIAAAGSIAGMSEADILGVAAAVTSLGITAQMGGSSMTKLISDINSAVSSGENLDKWAHAAGMEADAFSKAWGDDAAGALDMFIHGLHDAYSRGEDIYSILSDLEISEIRQVTMITSMAKSGDRLTDTLKTANTAWTENTALTSEAEKRYGTMQSQLVLMQNAYNNLKVAIGDSYTPELRELYTVTGELLGELTEFVQLHPELIKAATAFVGVIGMVVAALTAYAIGVKVATAVTSLFTSAIPGVGTILAVTAGIAALTAAVVGLAEANKVGREELDEYEVAQRSLLDSYNDTISVHKEANRQIDTEQQNVVGLIGKLAELTSTTDNAAENHQAILTVIDALNEAMPELGVSYDKVANASEGYIDSLYEIAKAQADQMELEKKWSEYIDRVGKQEALKEAKETAEKNAEFAQQEYALAKEAYGEAYAFHAGTSILYKDEVNTLTTAKDKLDTYSESLDETSKAYNENASAIAELEDAFKAYQGEQDAASAGTADMRDLMKQVTTQMKDLQEAYGEAYDAALESVGGQYALWDTAAKTVETSANEINTAIDSQISYWENYNDNLANLTERSAGIEGLSELIASFADGSKDSVSAIAGMASASDEQLTKMVENWQKLKAEQETASGHLADLKTDFTNTMAELQMNMEATIAEMNLGTEAADSGKATIEGFINGAEGMLPEVQETYGRIAQAAVDAIDAKLDIHSPSRVMWDKAEMTWGGFIGGSEAMQPDVEAVMSDTAALGTDAISAERGPGGSGISIQLDYSPQYDLSGAGNASEIESVLREHDENLRDFILDVLQDAGIAAARGAYA